MTINFREYHSNKESLCKIVEPASCYAPNRENNEILVTFRQALDYLVKTIDILREPITNFSEEQQPRIEDIRKIFAFAIYKAKVQVLKQENQHLNRENLKELKAYLAKKLCEEFLINEENTCPCLNDRERLVEHAVQLIALDKKSGKLFLIRNIQKNIQNLEKKIQERSQKRPVLLNPVWSEIFVVDFLNNELPYNWKSRQLGLFHKQGEGAADSNHILTTLVSNGTKFSYAQSIDISEIQNDLNLYVTAIWETSIKGEINSCFTNSGAKRENYLGRKQLFIINKDTSEELYFKSSHKEPILDSVDVIHPIIADANLNILSRTIPFSSNTLPTNGCFFIHHEDLVAYLGNYKSKPARSVV